MTARVRAADLKRGDGVIWRGERQVVEAVQPDKSNPEIVDVHFFGLVPWQTMPGTMRLETTR